MLLLSYIILSPMIGSILAHELSGGRDDAFLIAFIGIPLVNYCLFMPVGA